jgi:hypothetical protein
VAKKPNPQFAIRQFLIRHSLMKPISILIASFILITFLPSSTLAQSSFDPWSSPLNLSHSGAATDPVMVVDSEGVIHVIWLDEFDGPMYTKGDGKNWDPPIPASLPFSDLEPISLKPILFTPVLVADSSGYVYAFWRDDENNLFASRVLASGLSASQWTESAFLADSVLDFSVVIDTQDKLHLSYVRTEDTPEFLAGVYYRQSSVRGDSWSAPALLYQSPYFRTLEAQQAHVDIEIANPGDAQHVYVTWDNRPRGRVFLAKSDNGGQAWSDPQEIDKPEQGGGSATPYDLIVYAQDDKVLLVWGTGGEDTGCSQYYQWSLDGGETWQPRQRFAGGFIGCPENNHILKGLDGPILLLASTQVYLQAWEGARWSDPQVQSNLASFTDPETQQTVDLACLHPDLVGSQLLVVGCNAGEDSGDIWWLRRELTDTAEWFPQESVWQPLTSVTRSESGFLSLSVVADTEERIHVFWSQSGAAAFDGPDSALYYTRWEGERLWSQPVAILASPEEPADQPAVALDPAGRLLVVWRRGFNGEIYFSQASANQAVLPEAWSKPQRLSAPDQMISAPDILVDSDGGIYVVYAMPVNEGRGLYLTHSGDGGQTWSAPARVFDAASAGWAMLDQPRLTLTGNRDLHLLWTRYNLRSGQAEPLALAYAHSQDGGVTWSAPETVVETPVIWSRILGVGTQTVHRFWQELTAGQTTTLWHERSLDNGQTWERIAPISIFGQAAGSPSLTWDRAGNLHLLQIVSRGTGGYVLQHWIWDGQRWTGSNSLNLDVQAGTALGGMTSAVSPGGNLAVILSGRVEDQDLATQENELFFTARSIDLPEGLPTPLPPAPVIPAVTQEQPTLEATAPPTPTPTPNLAALSAGEGNAGNSWKGLIIGGVLAGVIVATAFGIGVWRVKSWQR